MAGNRFNAYSSLEIGIGLRSPHLDHILSQRPDVSWFEIISENYMVDGGRPLHTLDRILEQYAVVQHGVGLYIGSEQGIDRAHLRRLKDLTRRTGTPWVSDHLCWGSVDGTTTHDLLPLPYNRSAIARAVDGIRTVQDSLGLPFAVENVSSYAEFHESEMTEWEFLSEVVERADAGILLDVNNIYVSSINHGFDPMVYLEALPHERVAQIHIAGHARYERFVIDTHDHPVIDPVWRLYARAIELCGPTPTLLEWDARIPSFPEVHAEALKATRYWKVQGRNDKVASAPVPTAATTDPKSSSALHRLQRRFVAALREPIFEDSRARTDLPQREGGVSEDFGETARALITPSATLEPVERLELYHRQYWYRLLDSLEEDFPALRSLLGEDAYWRLLEAFVERVPPTSFTLRHLGRGLADFVAAHPDLVPHPVHTEDLARLEYALCAAFEAGEHPGVAAAELQSAQIDLQPHLQLLALRTDADDLWRKLLDDQPAGELRPASPEPTCFVVVFRQSLRLHVERVDEAAFSILSTLASTHSLEATMDQASTQPSLLGDDAAARVRHWFGTWTSRRWLRRADPTIAPSQRVPREPIRPRP